MDDWDEAAADAAVVALARTAGAHEIFEIFARYGARDFRDIGHKAIYVANSFRTLEVIGWQHAESVLRSLAYALLEREGAGVNPAKADLPADRPYRENIRAVTQIRPEWLDGRPSEAAATEMLRTLRDASPEEARSRAIELLYRGAAPASLFDAFFEGAAELMMRSPGILSLHATTFTNAVHYAWRQCRDDHTRRLLLLQNASFLPLFRGSTQQGIEIDTFEPAPLEQSGPAALEEIFSEVSRDRLAASRKLLTFLSRGADAAPVADGAQAHFHERHRLARLQVQLRRARRACRDVASFARSVSGGGDVLSEGIRRSGQSTRVAGARRRGVGVGMNFSFCHQIMSTVFCEL
jgi:hypothetical protein